MQIFVAVAVQNIIKLLLFLGAYIKAKVLHAFSYPKFTDAMPCSFSLTRILVVKQLLALTALFSNRGSRRLGRGFDKNVI